MDPKLPSAGNSRHVGGLGDYRDGAGMVAAIVVQLGERTLCAAVVFVVLVMTEVLCRALALVLAIAAHRGPGYLERDGE